MVKDRPGFRIAVLGGLAALCVFVAFYNLESSPRTWQDEGAVLGLARTLASEGVYATRTGSGLESFGPVQSVGPTLIVPLALVFRLFGVGLLQARLLMAGWLLLTLLLFFALARRASGERAAVLATLLLLTATPATLIYGRQALGDIPALSFFLAGVLVLVRPTTDDRRPTTRGAGPTTDDRGRRPTTDDRRLARSGLLAGLLFGAAVVTKAQYLALGGAALLLSAAFCWWRGARGLALSYCGALLVALGCALAWQGWQFGYFGGAVYAADNEKLRALSASVIGLSAHKSWLAIKFLLGGSTLYGYFFAGLPALIYGLWRQWRTRDVLPELAALLLCALWLGYFVLLIVPATVFAFVPLALLALPVARLAHDLTGGLRLPDGLRTPGQIGRALALLAVTVGTGYGLVAGIRAGVLSHDAGPQQTAAYLRANVPPDALVETWERELGVLTDNRYHYPDQSLLITTQAAWAQNRPYQPVYGADYFAAWRPDYLVIGWYARDKQIYDPAYLAQHTCPLAAFGEGLWRYEILRVSLDAPASCPAR